MKETIKINAVIRQDVFIEPIDAFIGIKKALGFGDKLDNSIKIQDAIQRVRLISTQKSYSGITVLSCPNIPELTEIRLQCSTYK